MRAILAHSLDGPDGLACVELPDPDPGSTPGPNEVIVRVAGCALNFMDTLITRGRYQIKPELPFSPGAEIGGTIERIGEAVTGYEVGDRVMAYVGYGGARSLVSVSADRLVHVPEPIDLTLASSLTVTYGTALYALRTRVGLGRAGKKAPVVAVLGASCGAGMAAVEVAAALGADVIAAASTVERAETATPHGANHFIGYRDADLKQALRDATDGRGPDIIYDCVGDQYAEPALRAIAAGGTYVVIGFAGGEIPKLPANIILLKDCDVIGIHWGAAIEADVTPHRDNMQFLLDGIVAGRIRPRPPVVRPLAETPDAIRDIAARKVIGKIVVTP